ncbi:nephrin [Eurytemora carolleeae]|uniref:nephrin n=1 Tax=Eurytemora carolleeae TaxID=1294199 RepID=UPI000C775D36|nr:nephrin [Eurytemora carolleeae]|eukprot:XP_023339623.1 nephrin-like [Eurytemora affinis]
MFTYPVFIKLTGPEGEMSDGNNYSFQCESEGSNPPADLEWFLKGKKIPNPQVLKSGNSSSSNLSIIADYRLDGENVSCIVFNKELKHKKLISNHTLSIQYSPILKLTMGANLNSNKIIQGTDVFFQCSILSKPKEYKVEWYMNDERVEENISAGIIITDSSLVIQKVGLMAGGEYGCRASNIQGDGYSNKIHLNILYAPRCSRSKGSHLVPIRSRRNLTCSVDSNPQPSSYYWSINTTGQEFKLLNQTEGFLDLSTIETEGTLECFAINSIGEMQKPCSWTAVEIGIPDPPTQCKILNQSVSWMDISCNPAWDGGLDQVFHLEVYNSSPFTLIRNISNTGAPAFTVKRLEPAQHLTMTIYSSNAKGRSSVIEIESSTSKLAAAVLSDGVEEADRAEVPLGIILGVTSTLLIIIIIILLLILARRHRGESMPSDEEMEIRLSTNLLEKSRETPILTSSSLLSKPNQLERQGQKNAGKPRLLDSTEPEPGISDGRFLRSCTGTPDSQYLLHGDEYTNNEAFKEDDYKIYSPDEDTDTFSDFERKQFKGKILNPSVRNINIKINPNYM